MKNKNQSPRVSKQQSAQRKRNQPIPPSGETGLTIVGIGASSILASVQHVFIQGTDAILYFFIDITERVKAEVEIHRLNIERNAIEQKERQRIAQLLHDDLQQRLFAIKMHLISLDETL
jgi:signal transduction histidine kinase